MEEITLIIKNWDRYQTKSERVRYKHWFRVNMDSGSSNGLFGLSAEQRWFWIQLLCECCRKNKSTISVKIDRFARLCDISKSSIISAIKILEENETVSVMSNNSRPTHNLLNTHNSTEQNITEQNITQQNRSLIGSKAKALPPEKKTFLGKRLVGVYITSYQQRYGVRPVITNKVAGLIKLTAEELGIDYACDLVQTYLQMDDPWFKTKSHDFETFRANLNKVSTALQTGIDPNNPPKPKIVWEEQGSHE